MNISEKKEENYIASFTENKIKVFDNIKKKDNNSDLKKFNYKDFLNEFNLIIKKKSGINTDFDKFNDNLYTLEENLIIIYKYKNEYFKKYYCKGTGVLVIDYDNFIEMYFCLDILTCNYYRKRGRSRHFYYCDCSSDCNIFELHDLYTFHTLGQIIYCDSEHKDINIEKSITRTFDLPSIIGESKLQFIFKEKEESLYLQDDKHLSHYSLHEFLNIVLKNDKSNQIIDIIENKKKIYYGDIEWKPPFSVNKIFNITYKNGDYIQNNNFKLKWIFDQYKFVDLLDKINLEEENIEELFIV